MLVERELRKNMALLRCNICGGDLELNADMSLGVCLYCGSAVTIPKNFEKKERLYNRATFLRQNNEFDRAMAVYEDLLMEDNKNAEAHWGFALSKYGIEYIKDPDTGDYIPTCHRTQKELFSQDIDCKAAIQFANNSTAQIYIREAQRIDEIQKKILDISIKEPPYDIFICYKETDQDLQRTLDSVLAQEIYQELIKNNYKVFFSRKTLEYKLGIEYEPIIFSALSSAKIMLVVCTNPEYLNAVWVKNEWSRFLQMAGTESKVIIPVYRDISPYELPEALASKQSLDMAKLGFMQDLIDGINKILKQPSQNPYTQSQSLENEKLIQNASTYLQLGNYDLAEETYTKITGEYPEDYRGWWGKMVCVTENFTKLPEDCRQINVWFAYVRKLAADNIFPELEEQYCAYLKNVSAREANSDMKKTKDLIGKTQKTLAKLQSEKITLENTKNELIENFQRTLCSRETELEQVKSSVTDMQLKAEDLEKKAKKFRKTFTLCIVLGIFFLVTPLFIIDIFVMVYVWRRKQSLDFDSKKANDEFQAALFSQNTLEKTIAEQTHGIQKELLDSKVKESNAKIRQIESSTLLLQANLDKLNQYLNLGYQRIFNLHYALMCREIGTVYELKAEDNQLRQAVLKP